METKRHIPERRSAVRHKVSLPVETDRAAGLTRDFSLSGLYLVTDSPVSLGECLHLRVAVPDRGQAGPHWLAATGNVVRVERTGETVGVAIALEDEGLQLLQPGETRA